MDKMKKKHNIVGIIVLVAVLSACKFETTVESTNTIDVDITKTNNLEDWSCYRVRADSIWYPQSLDTN